MCEPASYERVRDTVVHSSQIREDDDNHVVGVWRIHEVRPNVEERDGPPLEYEYDDEYDHDPGRVPVSICISDGRIPG